VGSFPRLDELHPLGRTFDCYDLVIDK
jgi:hypothetical protein